MHKSADYLTDTSALPYSGDSLPFFCYELHFEAKDHVFAPLSGVFNFDATQGKGFFLFSFCYPFAAVVVLRISVNHAILSARHNAICRKGKNDAEKDTIFHR